MAQFLCIGLYGPFTSLSFTYCAIYFDLKGGYFLNSSIFPIQCFVVGLYQLPIFKSRNSPSNFGGVKFSPRKIATLTKFGRIRNSMSHPGCTIFRDPYVHGSYELMPIW